MRWRVIFVYVDVHQGCHDQLGTRAAIDRGRRMWGGKSEDQKICLRMTILTGRANNGGFKACEMEGLPSLDFAGLLALVGANVTKAGIPYTCLIWSRLPYVNAYVPVRTFGVAKAVLSCIDWRPARILIGAGEAGSMLALCGLKASGKANYVGLNSATALPVRGIVGEAVVLELVKQGKERVCPSLIGRNANRTTTVVWATIFEPDKIHGEVHVSGDKGALINYLATSVSAMVVILEAICHEWLYLSLIIVGMLLNVVMTFLLRVQKFEMPAATPAEGVPEGDSVITLKHDPDVFCVLRGTEKAIQKLLQKDVTLNAGWVEQWPLLLVSISVMVYSVVVLLGVPNMNPSAQLLFLVVVCIGSMTDLIKGSWDVKREIANAAIEKYAIQIKDVKKFGNRTASIASVAARITKVETLKASGLCPTTGPVWKNWWTALAMNIRDHPAIDKSDFHVKLDPVLKKVHGEDKKLLEALIEDMWEGLQHATLRTT